MSVEIKAGWMYGTLRDDKGVEWGVRRIPQASTGAEHANPNLVLHTTETDRVVSPLKYPSNFQCGDGFIFQHIRLGESGDAVWTYDKDNVGIEMVGRSKLQKWLPAESTLGPTVALVAWLHETGRIRTGLKRPREWPVVLDKLPAAVTTYYRRSDPTKLDGVYGHVDLAGGNSHWDPGSFDYPTFFARVQAALDGGDDEMAYKDFKAGWSSFVKGDAEPPAGDDFGFGYRAARQAFSNPKAAEPVPGGPHHHTVKVLGRTFDTSQGIEG